MSPAAAASAAVAARARGPSRPTRSVRVSGPRLLLSTTSWPASTASRATVPPMFPLPMSPMVVTYGASPPPVTPLPERSGRLQRPAHLLAAGRHLPQLDELGRRIADRRLL